MRKGTGSQTWPLTSPHAQPTFAAAGQVRFDLNDVPSKSPTGPLANYIPALILTFIGALVNAGESPDPVQQFDLPGLLVQSVQLQNAWHATPIASDYWLGEHLRIIEYIGNGYQLGQRISGAIIPTASPGENASFSVRLPLCKGQLARDTALLALLYQPSSLIVKMKDASVLDGVSTGTTWVGTVVCSAELDPRPEIVLGSPVEFVLHRQVASPSGPVIQIKGFGRSSHMTGVDEKGGVLSLMELTSAGEPSLGGVFSAEDVTGYGFDWRGQEVTNDVRAVLNVLVAQIPDHMPGIPISGLTDPAQTSNERTVFPYFNLGAVGAGGANDADPLNAALLAWMMVMSGDDVRLTDAQTAESDQPYRLEGPTFSAGDHLILAEYVKRWTDGKRGQFFAKVMDGGQSSLAAHVLGARFNSAQLVQRAPIDKHSLTGDEMTYCAWQLEVARAA